MYILHTKTGHIKFNKHNQQSPKMDDINFHVELKWTLNTSLFTAVNLLLV